MSTTTTKKRKLQTAGKTPSLRPKSESKSSALCDHCLKKVALKDAPECSECGFLYHDACAHEELLVCLFCKELVCKECIREHAQDHAFDIQENSEAF